MFQSRAGSSSSPETMCTGGLGAYISQKACSLPRRRPEDTSPGLVCTADASRPTTHSERDKSGPRHVPDGNQELRPRVRRHEATRKVCRHHPSHSWPCRISSSSELGQGAHVRQWAGRGLEGSCQGPCEPQDLGDPGGGLTPEIQTGARRESSGQGIYVPPGDPVSPSV